MEFTSEALSCLCHKELEEDLGVERWRRQCVSPEASPMTALTESVKEREQLIEALP